MKVVFVNPSNHNELMSNIPSLFKKDRGRIPALGIMYLASIIRDRHDPYIIDAQIEDLSAKQVAQKVAELEPDVVGFSVTSFSLQDTKESMDELRKLMPHVPIICGGPHVVIYPEETITGLGADYAVAGEAEMTIRPLLEAIETGNGLSKKKVWPQGELINDLDNLPIPSRDLLQYDRYWNILSDEYPVTTAFSSRSCPYTCLSGDTLVNTIYGNIPIKTLEEKYYRVPVYTYDIEKKKVIVSDAINFTKTGINKRLLRVEFTNGSFVNCTPDHRFLVFKNGNKFVDTREYEVEAQDLETGMSVRSYREETPGDGHKVIAWGRRKRQRISRMIMEYMTGRQLDRKEIVHHNDHNKLNDLPWNLTLYPSQKVHMAQHPDVSERMRVNNPSKSHLLEVRAKISAGGRGRKVSYEQRLNYSRSKIGERNPRWKGCGKPGYKSRYMQVNHKVKSVKQIPGWHDVYCLEVPETHWFFVNDHVLISNCTFCDRPAMGRGFRAMSAKRIADEMEACQDLGIKEIMFYDDTFTVAKPRVFELCKEIERRKIWIKWDIRTRVDTVNQEMLKAMSKAGCVRIHYGVESGVQKVLNAMDKGITPDRVEQVFEWTRQAGMKTMGLFMIGNPRETKKDIDETIRFAKQIKCDHMVVGVFSPYPATKLYFDAMNRGLLTDVWKDYAKTLDPGFRSPLWLENFTKDELVHHLKRFYAKFYLRPSFIWKELISVKSWGQLWRKIQVGIHMVWIATLQKFKR